VPQLVWLSEHKGTIFALAALMLAVAGVLQWRARGAPCPIEPALRHACLRTRRLSARVYLASVALFLVGGWFAFVQPALS
jgi:CHASE2 domain-containing sensor protein